MRPIRFRSPYALGDAVVLTAAVRDLHRAHPGAFRISVETAAPDVWAHNPHVAVAGPLDQVIDLGEVTLDRSGATGRHYVHAYLDLINLRLGTRAEITEIKGDIHLSPQELRWHSDVWSLCGREIPFWIVATGGKLDVPLKWWPHERFQQVVDALQGRIQFVQVGDWGHEHPRLNGVIDLRGKTTVRDLIHLMHYADGVLCGVTSLMHLAAAVPTETGQLRHAVIIGGAREPASWEAYPGHEFLSTARAVPCGHCWKNTLQECSEPRAAMPLCLDLIGAEEVVARIESLVSAAGARMLSARDRPAARRAQDRSAANDFDLHNVNSLNAPRLAAEFIGRIPPYPTRRYEGRGIVICAGGVRYFTCAWICIRMLRRVGCTLPIELWHLGREEIDRAMEDLLRPFGVRCVNALSRLARSPMRNPLGWELKAYALLHSRFQEVLFLDADNVPVRDPSFLFDTREFRATGALFWPDYGRLSPRRKIWEFCDVAYRNEPEFESGQMVIDKARCWRPLNLAWWYNDHSEFFFRHVHGDKETFHMAWRRVDAPYSMTAHPVLSLQGTMCQHDFEGKLLFQHRNTPKWNFYGSNPNIPGFMHEADCLSFLEELRSRWNGRIGGQIPVIVKNGWIFRRDTIDEIVFTTVVAGNEYHLPHRLSAEDLVLDIGGHIGSFVWACHLRGSRNIVSFEPHPENFALARVNVGQLEGVRLRRAAVHAHSGWVRGENFPELGGLLNTGGCSVRPSSTEEAGRSRCLSVDRLLRQLGLVKLMKLDCEGSEWPILLNCTEWSRVEAVCGEYHLGPKIVERFDCGNTLAPGLLLETLKKSFSEVVIEPPGDDLLGRFWAARTKRFFVGGD